MTLVRFVVPDVDRSGGVFHGATRLATALTEQGLDCDVVISPSDRQRRAVAPGLFDLRTLELLGGRPERNPTSLRGLRAALADGGPELLVVDQGDVEVLETAASVAPTVLHAQMSWPACPDATRYWHRAERECTVRAGWKCLPIRPLLGCSGLSDAVRPLPVLRRRRLADMISGGELSVIAISGPQAQLLREAGAPDGRLCVVPNLGMRLSADELARAAAEVAIDDRSAVVFFGRLTKSKGGLLLERIARVAPAPGLRVFGDGYLRDALRPVLAGQLRGAVGQAGVAGMLTWARAVVFPSLWPEPGGIVGIDAQLFGVPTGAFAVGSPLDWPGVQRFAPGDGAALARWAADRPDVTRPRDPAAIAERQRRYWDRVGARAAIAVRSLLQVGRFPSVERDAVTADLRASEPTAV